MAHKHKSPAAGTARDLEKMSAVGTADVFSGPLQPQKIQQNRIRERVSASDSVAAVYASLAYGIAETWSGRP